jgi:hypothetical protein
MQFDANDPRIIVTSGGTYCLFDEAGRLVGTIERPIERIPVGAGRETVYLARASTQKGTAAA